MKTSRSSRNIRSPKCSKVLTANGKNVLFNSFITPMILSTLDIEWCILKRTVDVLGDVCLESNNRTTAERNAGKHRGPFESSVLDCVLFWVKNEFETVENHHEWKFEWKFGVISSYLFDRLYDPGQRRELNKATDSTVQLSCKWCISRRVLWKETVNYAVRSSDKRLNSKRKTSKSESVVKSNTTRPDITPSH